jgi:hypothetical protein
MKSSKSGRERFQGREIGRKQGLILSRKSKGNKKIENTFKEINVTFSQTSRKMNFMTTMLWIIEIISLIQKCALSEKNLKEIMSCCTNASGSRCGHNWSAVLRIGLRAIIAISVKREKYSIICNIQL